MFVADWQQAQVFLNCNGNHVEQTIERDDTASGKSAGWSLAVLMAYTDYADKTLLQSGGGSHTDADGDNGLSQRMC